MKYRSIEEAIHLKIPDFPETCENDYSMLDKQVKFGNESAKSKLGKIYSLTDKLTQLIAPYMVCEKNCSHCCKLDVLITTVEAQYIEQHHGLNRNIGTSVSSGHADNKTPCPFLDRSGACSIYKSRPFACRTAFAVDNPMYCEEVDREHVTYSSRNNSLLSRLYYMIIHINEKKPVRDIRDFFQNTD